MSGPAPDYPWLAELADIAAYPFDPGTCDGQGTGGGVSRIDTHISHVFLTAARAYKLRRPVSLGFLDFATGAERLADCLREVALNRRLAPDVYLGIAPILQGDRVHVGEVREEPATGGDVLEHCVVMRRLPAGRDLRSMLARGEARPEHVDRVATRIAAFHAAHSLPRPPASGNWLEQTTAPARANFEALRHAPADLAPPATVGEACSLAERFAEEHRGDFEARRRAGRVVDGHGDLHAEHVWFETDEAEPLMVDCLEFRDDFRRINAASDVAFLAMDLAYRGRADLGARFLRRYARASGDYHLYAVVDYFLAYRALVRAKVASLVAVDATLAEGQRAHATHSVRDHLDLALGFLRERGPGAVVLVCGSIGTGKTTLAEELADATGGVVLSSDWIRRLPAGPGPLDSAEGRGSGPGSDESPVRGDCPARGGTDGSPGTHGAAYGASRYAEAAREAVYDRMLAEAVPVVASGRTVILDATFGRRSWREKAQRWAEALSAQPWLVEAVAPEDVVLARLKAREAAGTDASEAGPSLVHAMRAEYEEPAEWKAERRFTIDTAAPDRALRVREIAQALVTAPRARERR